MQSILLNLSREYPLLMFTVILRVIHYPADQYMHLFSDGAIFKCHLAIQNNFIVSINVVSVEQLKF